MNECMCVCIYIYIYNIEISFGIGWVNSLGDPFLGTEQRSEGKHIKRPFL